MQRVRRHRNALWPRLSAGLLAAVLLPGAGIGFQDNRVMVVSVSGIRPMEEAVEGLREGFGQSPPWFVDLKSPSGESELAEALRKAPPRIVVTVGMDALKTVAAHPSAVAILATMVLRSDGAAILAEASRHPVVRRVAAVYLDVPAGDVAPELRALFPGKHRIGALHNPSREGHSDTQWQARLRQQGFVVEVREVGRPEELLRSFLSLKRKVDFVLLSPDSSLYNEATVKPLILASLENQLPIVGFSASFVRAGAAVGVYPEFHDIGLQAAEAVHRFLAVPADFSDETPRKLSVGVNAQVLRLLGLEPHASAGHAVVPIK